VAVTEQELVTWLESHGYYEFRSDPRGRKGRTRHFRHETPITERVALHAYAGQVKALTWSADGKQPWIDRTWIPEMDTLIKSGALTPLEARNKYRAQIEALRKTQQEAA
jgi:hypothetical protein